MNIMIMWMKEWVELYTFCKTRASTLTVKRIFSGIQNPLQIFSSVAILAWRSSNRIDGTFMNYEIEQKIDDLEQKLDATNNLVVELVNWLTEEASGNDGLS